ncbi:MAG: FAD-dependent oxidoreductase [Candidatus Pacebacteria bacterium]|nr:FAD-dependent oxidoreductase [Candidatus Paceibacterota bacterium]
MGLPPELAFVFGETANVFHRTRVISREMVAVSTLALTIERPENFAFTSGQNTMVSIPGIHAEMLKEFTIASAPYEASLVLAMRVRNSKFKDACYALKPNDAIMVRHPSGSLWEASAGPQIWLSGGIGITPFRSIIRELLHQNSSLDITHIHSDRSRSSIPFLSEFESYAAEHTDYRFIPTMTGESVSGELKGRISADMIGQTAPNYAESAFFVVGGDSFVASMRDLLAKMGVAPTMIRIERFEGYKI